MSTESTLYAPILERVRQRVEIARKAALLNSKTSGPDAKTLPWTLTIGRWKAHAEALRWVLDTIDEEEKRE